MKRVIIIILIAIFCLLGLKVNRVSAMPVGTLLYRTSSDGQLYGLNQKELISKKKGIIDHIYSGHSAIYVGKINGIDYIVEALAGGLQKTEAKYFIDQSQGEKFLGAKIPKNASAIQRQMAAEIALALSEYHFGYDFDFHKQKGPADGEWTCVGLTEKVYESADISNPYDFSKLKYNNDYAIDITPDGYDDYSTYNSRSDVFSRSKEFSKIEAYTNTIFPSPELLGFNMGRQYQGKRYFFFPYTQFLQDSLKDVELDIDIGSNTTRDVRPETKALPVALKWTFINQPLSMIKKVTDFVKEQRAVAYSADNNDYEFEYGDSEGSYKGKSDNDIERDSAELSVLLNEELNLNNDSISKEKLDYLDILKYIEESNIQTGEKENNDNNKILSDLEGAKFIEKNKEYNIKDIISADTFLLENDIQVTLASIYVPQLRDKLWQANECQAEEAFSFVNKVLSDTKVKLRYSDRKIFDNSSRLVSYIYFKDKDSGEYKLLNNELLRLGLANILDCKQEIYCDLNIHRQLKESHQYAKDNELGVFSKDCVGDIDKNSDKANKLSSLGKNLFKGISLKAGQIINSLGQVINIPKLKNSSEDVNNLNDNDSSSDNIDNSNNSSDDTKNGSNNDSNTNNNNDNDHNDNNLEDTYNACVDSLLISAVYSTAQDDWIELYNDCDEDIDLSEAGLRLEKAVSGVNPSIIIRFDQEEDFSASDTMIYAHDNYIISRSEANLNFNVNALSLRNNFSLGDSGYSLYLAKGPVSDMHDEDIIDLLGYGSSNYFRGQRPASAIDDYYVLRRKANINSNAFNLYPHHDYGLGGIYNSGHNFQDFILVDTGLEPIEENEDNTNVDDNDNTNDDSTNDDSTNDDSNDDSNDDNTNDNTNNEDEVVDDGNSDEPVYNTCIDELLITAVYTTLQDDYIEIFNNCDQSIDLMAENIRLEKAISREDPAIILRFDETDDYVATSTVVAPYSSYTISRDESALDINFEAVSLRNDFSLSGDAYSIYLAKGPVSGPDDEDIIDILGYGTANYYLGSGPATYIDDYMLLRRKADINSSASTLDIFHDYSVSGIYNTSNNFSDFISIASNFNSDANDDENNDEDEENNTNLNNISSIWHLDNCYGNILYDTANSQSTNHTWQWSARNSSCVLRANSTVEALDLPVQADLDANNMSVLWDYQIEQSNGRLQFELVTVEGDNLILMLSPYFMEITMPGHSKKRFDDITVPNDKNWHSIAFTTDSSRSTVNIYLDNVILTSFTLGQRLFDLNSIKFIADSSHIKIDEVAVFNKVLEESDLNSLAYPIEPYQERNIVGTVDLKHSWNFIEGQGNIALDTISAYDLNVEDSHWSLGINDFGINLSQYNSSIVSDLSINPDRKSYSISFWYKNSSYPDAARGIIRLMRDVDTKIGLKFTPYNSYLYYNNDEIPLSYEDVSIPHDDNWHHIVLTYNANDYSLNMYLDGSKLYSEYKPYLETIFNHMEIVQENYDFQVDEIEIYEGTLDSDSIYNTYQQKYY